MKKNLKLLSLLLAVVLLIGMFPTPVIAAEDEDFTNQITLATDFLTASAENEWLGQDNDLSKYIDEESLDAQFSVDRVEVLSRFRSLSEYDKKDFNSSYTVEFSGRKDFDIVVRLIENISFLENEKQNHYNSTYMIVFNNDNKITDVQKNDWFEAAYKNSGKTKEIIFAELTKEFINNMEPDVSSLKEKDIFSNAETQNVQYMMYDVNNAVNYALTYSGDSEAFYNQNFDSYKGKGGDCMNFASQAIFAGLGGNNVPDILETGKMFNNYDLDDEWGTWQVNKGPWLGVVAFQNYVTDQTPKENGLISQVWRIEADQWDLGIDESLLLGSIVLVPGEDEESEFGHAIVLTEVNGTTRDDLKYSGHTSDKRQGALSKDYRNVPMLVVRPIYYKLTHKCLFGEHLFHTIKGLISGDGSNCIWCGYNRLYITNKLIAPALIGDTVTLGSKASMNVFKMSICVEDPNGEVTWLRDEYNTNFIKRQLTLSKPGLYKITTYAQDVNDILSLEAVEESSTYYIRVTGINPDEMTGESEYIDSDYFNDNQDIDFIPNSNMG